MSVLNTVFLLLYLSCLLVYTCNNGNLIDSDLNLDLSFHSKAANSYMHLQFLGTLLLEC